MRLIVPQQQSTAEDAPLNAQPAAGQGAGQAAAHASSADSNSKQAATRSTQTANGATSISPAAGTNGPITTGIAPPLNASANGAAVSGQGAGSITGITGTGAPGGVSSGGMPLDQVNPPRTGNGKSIEHPVTLKLKMTASNTNGNTPLSETEISAAEAQIGRGLTAAFRQNTPQVTLWMSPETLGKVRIQLTFDQGAISARFEATSEATKDLLAQNMGALRDALQSRGLTANQIEVVSIPDWSHQNNGSQTGNNGGRAANEQMPDQSSSGGNLPFGQGGHQQNGTSEHSKGWAALPQGNGGQQVSTPSETQVSVSIDPRLMTLKAHLELDAVA